MLRDLLIAIGGLIVLVGIWVLTQRLARRQLPDLPVDGDVLAGGACNDAGTCRCGAMSNSPAGQSTRSRSAEPKDGTSAPARAP